MLAEDNLYASPTLTYKDRPLPWKLETKIEVFADRVNGWQLDVATRLLPNPHDIKNPSGFAVLHIVTSYFEMIGKYLHGSKSKESGKFFRKGFLSVFPELAGAPEGKQKALLGVLYDEVRCGLYHSAMVGRNIGISWQLQKIVEFDGQVAMINPILFVEQIRTHFSSYVEELRNPANEEVRKLFEARFDHDWSFGGIGRKDLPRLGPIPK